MKLSLLLLYSSCLGIVFKFAQRFFVISIASNYTEVVLDFCYVQIVVKDGILEFSQGVRLYNQGLALRSSSDFLYCKHDRNFYILTVKCPEEWTLNGKNCYRFFEKKMSWGDASDHCNVLKGSLVSIECSDDNLYVKGKLRRIIFSVCRYVS